MPKRILCVLLIMSSFVITACSEEEDKLTSEEPDKEHFASDQKRALDKAKEVEQMLQDSVDKRNQQIEEQTR